MILLILPILLIFSPWVKSNTNIGPKVDMHRSKVRLVHVYFNPLTKFKT